MLKRLPFLCASLLALAACGHGGDNGSSTGTTQSPAAATAPAQSTPAPAATAPAAATTAPAATPATTAAPATADSSAARPAATPFVDDGRWKEGKDYELIEPAQPKVSGTNKVEVVEVFSFGCPACNAYHPTADKLAAELPANASMVFLPASFNPAENWPMLQRAYLTAKALGVDSRASMDAMYDAVWKSHELSAMNASGTGLKPHDALPTIEDAAKVYAKFGIDPKTFVATANSFAVNTQMKRADELVKAYGVPGTPTIVVDGKYRFGPISMKPDDSIALAKWLVAKEAAGK